MLKVGLGEIWDPGSAGWGYQLSVACVTLALPPKKVKKEETPL